MVFKLEQGEHGIDKVTTYNLIHASYGILFIGVN